ncbi:MAG TPA: SufS family cysteine desulfurase [Polyangiaceae bacterium]|nr:SufS family cysteine desulfurase [Polyangiaceae bacterium]
MTELPASGGASSTQTFSAEDVRRQFPALAQQLHQQALVYLDNAATVQKPECVLDEMWRSYTEYCANVHRGAHTLGERASHVYERARGVVQQLLHAASADEIVFGSGCTAAINLVARGFGDRHVHAGDEVIVSELEHHSNLIPWQELCARRGALLRTIPLDDQGRLRMDAYASLLGPRTQLVAVAHVSNALGTVNPIREITRLAHAAGALVLVDGAQAVARCPVDVRELGSDFYAFSGHKLYGPFGIGVLYARRELLEAMAPVSTGGGMVELVEAEHCTLAPVPRRFEAGTPNLAGAAGLARAIEWLQAIGLEQIEAHERELLAYARGRLGALEGVRLVGTAEPALGVVSFVLDGVHPHDISTVLDQCGVAVRAGHHCAQPVMRRFAVPATVRASFAAYNTQADVDALVAGLARVREVFGA